MKQTLCPTEGREDCIALAFLGKYLGDSVVETS